MSLDNKAVFWKTLEGIIVHGSKTLYAKASENHPQQMEALEFSLTYAEQILLHFRSEDLEEVPELELEKVRRKLRSYFEKVWTLAQRLENNPGPE